MDVKKSEVEFGSNEGPPKLPAASSLMSSRWSQDNLITTHPDRIYNGQTLQKLTVAALEPLLSQLQNTRGIVAQGDVHMGVFTWDLSCEGPQGLPLFLKIPAALDEAGEGGRRRVDLPRLMAKNADFFQKRGLGRHVSATIEALTLAFGVDAALLPALPGHHPVSFGQGSLKVHLYEDELSWALSLGPTSTATLLTEIIAALVYHYEPDEEGGTTICDVFINDGDFCVRRLGDSSFDVRLTAVRRRQGGVPIPRLILYLLQLMAYEDWTVADRLTGVPVLVSNPSVTFHGLLRGLGNRYEDLGQSREAGEDEARRWLQHFTRTREGHSYRPWVEAFLSGRLPPSFGRDVREHWWRLVPLDERYNLTAFQARLEGSAEKLALAREIKALLSGLKGAIGKPTAAPLGAFNLNEATETEIEGQLSRLALDAPGRSSLKEKLLARWPYRDLEHLVALVPEAQALVKASADLAFGHVVTGDIEGTLLSLGRAQKKHTSHELANNEIYGGHTFEDDLQDAALRCFPTFEEYFDTVLHNPTWGYYAHSVRFGRDGHFITHPESLSPYYGRWLCHWAYKMDQEMQKTGELSAGEPFVVVEFGAGNAFLARDFLAAAQDDAEPPSGADLHSFRNFSKRVSYRIYERSPSLRRQQEELLGAAASVSAGDARFPDECLNRDFPEGLKGLVLTNEVPDAFGVQKVIFEASGQASAVIVLPRIEASLLPLLGAELSREIHEQNTALRALFRLDYPPGELVVDGPHLWKVLEALWCLSPEERSDALLKLWLEEALVPAQKLPRLAEHLRQHAGHYATALAASNSGVLLYINLHAQGFMRGIGRCIKSGFVITIDYGDTTWGLVQGARQGDFPFRVYTEQGDHTPRPNDPYLLVGTQDLTSDVNFTELAFTGREVGLLPVHFGRERDVAGDQLSWLHKKSDEDPYRKLTENVAFKILIQSTRASSLFQNQNLTALPLFPREDVLPKSRRKLVASIRQHLSTLGAQAHSTPGGIRPNCPD